MGGQVFRTSCRKALLGGFLLVGPVLHFLSHPPGKHVASSYFLPPRLLDLRPACLPRLLPCYLFPSFRQQLPTQSLPSNPRPSAHNHGNQVGSSSPPHTHRVCHQTPETLRAHPWEPGEILTCPARKGNPPMALFKARISSLGPVIRDVPVSRMTSQPWAQRFSPAPTFTL